MNAFRKVSLILTLALVVVFTGSPCFAAEQYPARPIQAIVPFTAGGSTDVLARAVEKTWRKYSPQPLLIINKPGAGGVLGEEFVVRAKPDGYTLYMGQGSGHDVVMPHLQKMPFDPLKDITPVCRLSIHSIVICVSGKSTIKSMKDLLAYAKDHKITAAVTTAAGSADLAMRAIAKRANFTITTVPFPGSADTVTALAGGHLVVGASVPCDVMSHIKAGRFRAIGMALDKRDTALPNVPTLREQGVDVAIWGSVKGIAVPNGTPPEIVAYLESTFKKVCEDKEFIKTMATIGQPINYLNAKDWAVNLQQVYKDYGDLIKELDIRI